MVLRDLSSATPMGCTEPSANAWAQSSYCNPCSERAGPERTLSPTGSWARRGSGSTTAPGQLQPAPTATCQGRNRGTQGFASIYSIRKRKRDKKMNLFKTSDHSCKWLLKQPCACDSKSCISGQNQAGTSAWTTEASGLPEQQHRAKNWVSCCLLSEQE